jgi:2-amino-4-hydroxy-6-hydroxymethyldihydropteridine diphosphokinase
MTATEPEQGQRAWIGLGSNLGDPPAQLRSALAELGSLPGSRLLRHSRFYRSAPWGNTAQPPFVNAVAELATTLPPRALLDALLAIERAHGRCRDGTRWGPRTLDLDLLLHGAGVVREEGLTLPHPFLGERAFVLVPLAELDPALAIPGVGSVAALLARLDAGTCVPLEPGCARTE